MKNQTKIKADSIPQRIADLYGMLGTKGLTLRQVSEDAGYKYSVIRSQLSQGLISNERLLDIEQTAIDLPSARNLQPITQ